MANIGFDQRVRRRALAILWCGSFGIVLLLAWRANWFHRLTAPSRNPEPGELFARSFDGSSNDLRETVIVPTLDTPFPEAKSAIWCTSFQLAWNRLKSDVAGEPIQLDNAQPLADRLNQSEVSEADLDPGSYYAAAGLVRDGIEKRIQDQVAEKFPEVRRPRFDVPKNGAVAYGYLRGVVKFPVPYFENDEPFQFTDHEGRQNAIGAFGIRRKDHDAYRALRRQVAIVYADREFRGEFVLDPCQDSQPNQVLLARVKRQATLAATLADVGRKISGSNANWSTKSVHSNETLIVPNMNWRIEHHFTELEGSDKHLLNPSLPGLHLATALQVIRFRLDRGGVELESEAQVQVKDGGSRDFHFDRPYLIILKKRDAKHPFFVMWVDNTELLCPK
jgi:hypothetical protein